MRARGRHASVLKSQTSLLAREASKPERQPVKGHPSRGTLIRTLADRQSLYVWSKIRKARHMGLAPGEGTASSRPAWVVQRTGNSPYEVRGEVIQDGGLAPSGNRVSVYEAAKVPGVTVDTIRKRIKRGTIAPELETPLSSESQRPLPGLRRALEETWRAAKSPGGERCLTDEP